jgi:hypothetical protein
MQLQYYLDTLCMHDAYWLHKCYINARTTHKLHINHGQCNRYNRDKRNRYNGANNCHKSTWYCMDHATPLHHQATCSHKHMLSQLEITGQAGQNTFC